MIRHEALRNHAKALLIGVGLLALGLALPTTLGWVSYDFGSEVGRLTLAVILGMLPVVYVVGLFLVRMNNNVE